MFVLLCILERSLQDETGETRRENRTDYYLYIINDDKWRYDLILIDDDDKNWNANVTSATTIATRAAPVAPLPIVDGPDDWFESKIMFDYIQVCHE